LNRLCAEAQPPLYEWMLWSVQRATGPTLPSFLILKYGLLTATFALRYLVAKRLFADQRWAAVAALSPLLLYHIGWNLHEGVMQTMVLICAVAASMWSFIRLVERGRSVARCKFHIPKEGQALHVFLARSAFGSKQTRTVVRA
jgi:4-amino-4-deoxy-L-arabinose transferase-like glycosyltransferase